MLAVACIQATAAGLSTDDEGRMSSDLRIFLGQHIRQLRQARGWHQVDLSAHAEITRSHIVALELGRRSVCLDTLLRISSALDTTPADLLRAAQNLQAAAALSLKHPKNELWI